MRTITSEELNTILAAHKRWRETGGAEGARAYLARADLARANLADANLAGADLAGADLAGAYLADADLARADLADANLAGADLAGADLAGADLAGADLAGAYLARANLADADLARADLAGADLADANLADANLADADLARADLARAYLAGAYLARASMPAGFDRAGHVEPTEPYDRTRQVNRAERARRYRETHPDVPVVERLDARILEKIDSGAGKLDMGAWHSCETTHCRAGWAVHLAGEAGYALESKVGSGHAGRMIYLASTGRSPHFYATNERALEDIRERAAEQAAT